MQGSETKSSEHNLKLLLYNPIINKISSHDASLGEFTSNVHFLLFSPLS